MLNRIRIEETLQIKKDENKLAQEQKRLIQEESRVIDENMKKAKQEKRAQIETPEIIWEGEFNEFKKNSLFFKFKQILEGIYNHGGLTKDRYDSFNNNWGFAIDTNVLIYADANNLINLSSNNHFVLTEKGKFFTKKYSQTQGDNLLN